MRSRLETKFNMSRVNSNPSVINLRGEEPNFATGSNFGISANSVFFQLTAQPTKPIFIPAVSSVLVILLKQ